jgi:hypothetical protein
VSAATEQGASSAERFGGTLQRPNRQCGCYTSDFLKKCISSQTPRDMGKQTCITLMENSRYEFDPHYLQIAYKPYTASV